MEKASGSWHRVRRQTDSRARSDSLFTPRATQARADALFVLTLHGHVCIVQLHAGKLEYYCYYYFCHYPSRCGAYYFFSLGKPAVAAE